MMSDNSMGNYDNVSYGEANSIRSAGDLVN